MTLQGQFVFVCSCSVSKATPCSPNECSGVVPLSASVLFACLCVQHYSFYDFIVNKARGKSGPLFSFDVHDDVRMVNDAKVEKEEVRGVTVCKHTHTHTHTHTHAHARTGTLPPSAPLPSVPCWQGGNEELVRT